MCVWLRKFSEYDPRLAWWGMYNSSKSEKSIQIASHTVPLTTGFPVQQVHLWTRPAIETTSSSWYNRQLRQSAIRTPLPTRFLWITSARYGYFQRIDFSVIDSVAWTSEKQTNRSNIRGGINLMEPKNSLKVSVCFYVALVFLFYIVLGVASLG